MSAAGVEKLTFADTIMDSKMYLAILKLNRSSNAENFALDRSLVLGKTPTQNTRPD